jgi:hypothetical protein
MIKGAACVAVILLLFAIAAVDVAAAVLIQIFKGE